MSEPPAAHVWWARPAALLGEADLLDASERRRAEGLRPVAREGFVASRVLLRRGLSRLGGHEPRAWRFASEPRGRPHVVNPDGAMPWVSLSHTRGLVACAVASCSVGVDAEALDRRVDATRLAGRFFTAEECAELAELDPEARRLRWLALWTLKEAYGKACGDGVARALAGAAFQIAADGGVRARLDADSSAWAFQLDRAGATHWLATAASDAARIRVAEWKP